MRYSSLVKVLRNHEFVNKYPSCRWDGPFGISVETGSTMEKPSVVLCHIDFRQTIFDPRELDRKITLLKILQI